MTSHLTYMARLQSVQSYLIQRDRIQSVIGVSPNGLYGLVVHISNAREFRH